MEYRVLGPIEVADGERVVDIGPRMHRAVLALLLLDPGRVVSLDRLIDALWDGRPPAGAMGVLQVYVSNLRKALEPQRPPRAPPAVLVTQPPGYVLRADARTIDAVRFEDLVGSGRAALAAGDPGGAAATVKDALALWRGSPYAELGSEPFLQPEITRLTELRAGAVEDLVEAQLALGAHAAVVADLERLADEAPIRERRWQLLALALYRSGRQAEALRVLDRARRLLVDELGIDPGAPLRRLEGDILQQSPSLDWRPGPRGGTGAGRRPSSLVGRDAELGLLQAALDDVVQGAGRVALISGEPGIGKTRLAMELAEEASRGRLQVAWGRSHEGDVAPAYWPWVQILRALVAEGRPDAVRDAMAGGVAELAHLVPEVAGGAPPPPPSNALFDADIARTRLYDAVVGFVLRLAADRPVVLVVDDLHWADVPTLQLVELLAGRLPAAPVLLVCTYREHDASASEPVTGALGALARVPGLVRVRPQGLSPEEIGRLVREATGRTASADVVDVLHRRTDGNPFFVSELVRLLQSTGRLDDIPSGVRDVIRQRLARLPAGTVSLLGTAAVAGRDFTLDVVATASGLDDERALELVEAALAVGVVVDDPAHVGTFRFSHSLVRETVYGGLSGVRRARLHGAVGHALARTDGGSDDRAIEIADHLYAASAAGGIGPEAYDWSLRGGDRALRLAALDQAEGLFRRAVELAQREGQTQAQEAAGRELAARTRLAAALLMNRGYAAPEVAEGWSAAVERSRTVDGGPDVLTALWGAWSIAYVRAEFDRALAFAAELVARGEDRDDAVLRLVGHHCAGIIGSHLGDLAGAAEHFGHVERLVAAVPEEFYGSTLFEPDPRLGYELFGGLAECLAAGRDGSATLERAVADARRLDRPLGIVVALFLAALGRVVVGDRGPAATLAAEGSAVAEANGYRLLGAMADVVRGWAREDRALIGQALGVIDAMAARVLLPVFWGLQADVERGHGRFAEALALADRALAEAESTGERLWEPELRRLRAEVLVAVGGRQHWPEAEEALVQGAARAREQGAYVFEARLAEALRDGRRRLQQRPSSA